MLLLTNHKGQKRKTKNVTVPISRIKEYEKLPGVYCAVRNMLHNLKEETLISWKQQKRR